MTQWNLQLYIYRESIDVIYLAYQFHEKNIRCIIDEQGKRYKEIRDVVFNSIEKTSMDSVTEYVILK